MDSKKYRWRKVSVYKEFKDNLLTFCCIYFLIHFIYIVCVPMELINNKNETATYVTQKCN